MSVNDILNVSRTGIFAAQNTLQTVSHNIANANTPGFSRQTIPLENAARSGGGGGAGVQMADLSRQIDKLVDRRQELGTGELGRLDARARFLALIEQTFNDIGREGLSQRLDAVYAAADSLADNPVNPVEREEFVSRAGGLARFIQGMHHALSEEELPVDQEVDVKIADINHRLQSFREINNLIVRASASDAALDLKDQRRRMVLDLGALIDLQTLELPQDGLQLMTSEGQLLADPVFAATLTRTSTLTDTGFRGIAIDGREVGERAIRGGELGGLLEIRDQVIHGPSGFLTRLEDVTDEIRFQFNRVSSTTVSSDMFTLQASALDIREAEAAGMLDVTFADWPATADMLGYDGVMRDDMQRVVEGEIVFASGPDVDNLTLSTVRITPRDIVRDGTLTPGMTIRQFLTEVNQTGAVHAFINRDHTLQFSSLGQGYVYGVVSDSSNLLAALGIGAVFGGNGAGDMTVHPDLEEDSSQLGVGRLSTDDPYNPTAAIFDDGSNFGALAMSDIRNNVYNIGGRNASLMGHYAASVGVLGSVINQNRESHTAQQAAQEFIGTMRESISGVSMEEELTDLIRFQRAFQASSKVVGVADEMMQTIISMV